MSRIVSENGFDDGFKLDVTSFPEWQNLRKHIEKKYRRIDVLVNNAGGGVRIAGISEQNEADIDKANIS